MDQSHLYQQIFESIRDDILSGAIKPGASLPPMRKMTEQWGCTTGTIMRAYQELAHQGLVVSHVGKGTYEKWESESVQMLKKWLSTKQTKSAINNLGGYDTAQTGNVTWVS